MSESKNTVALEIGGRRWEGWQEVRVTRSVERVPSYFDLSVTEHFPDAGKIVIEPGQECRIRAGTDLLVTGYVDRYAAGIAPAAHKVRVSGRGKCQDLVDCSIINDGQTTQIGNAFLLATARRLAEPYGITVSGLAGDTLSGDPFIAEVLSLFVTETPFDVIERLARATGYLVYEGTDGNLIIGRVSDQRHATGFVEGINVQQADVTFAMDERFSEYRIVQTNIENLQDMASRSGNRDWNSYAWLRDTGVPRLRRKTIVVEQQFGALDFPERRGQWEMARRYGRSQAVTLTVDSWRDGEGRLWEPNRLARVHLPALKLPDRSWTIGDVTFRRGPDGEEAEITLMPPEAFQPQPTILTPFDGQVGRALTEADRWPSNPAVPRSGATGGTP